MMKFSLVQHKHAAPPADAQKPANPPKLPQDVLLHILQLADLPPITLARLNTLSRDMRDVHSSNTLWRHLLPPHPAQPRTSLNHYEAFTKMTSQEQRVMHQLWSFDQTDDDAFVKIYKSVLRYPNNWQISLAALKYAGLLTTSVLEAAEADSDLMLLILQRDARIIQVASDAQKNDKRLVLTAAKQSASTYWYASSEMQQDKDIAIAACRNGLNPSHDLWAGHLDDTDVAKASIASSGQNIYAFSARIQQDRELYLEAAKNGSNFEIPIHFLDDTEIVLAVTKNSPLQFDRASDRVRNIKSVVLQALEYGAPFSKLPSAMQDRDTFLVSMQSKPHEYRLAPKLYREDRDLAQLAISQYPLNIQYVSAELQQDPELILMAIKGGMGEALKYASNEMRDDLHIALQAVRANGSALEFISPRLKMDFDLAKAAVTNDLGAFKHYNGPWARQKELVLLAFTHQWAHDVFGSLDESFKADKDIIAAAIKLRNSGEAKQAFIDSAAEIRSDPGLALAAIELYPELISLTCSLKNDKSFILQALAYQPVIYRELPMDLRGDKKLAFKAVALDASNYLFMPAYLRKEPEAIKLAVYENPAMLAAVANDFVFTKDFLLGLVRHKSEAFNSIPEPFKSDQDIIDAAIGTLESIDRARQDSWPFVLRTR